MRPLSSLSSAAALEGRSSCCNCLSRLGENVFHEVCALDRVCRLPLPLCKRLLAGVASGARRSERALLVGCLSLRSEYDRGVNTFSPEGRLFQVEYALGAIKLGSTAIGIKTAEGVLVASERRVGSCLLESSSVQKIALVDSHIASAMSGLIADAK